MPDSRRSVSNRSSISLNASVRTVSSDWARGPGRRWPGRSGSTVRMSPVRRTSGVVARRMSTMLAATMTAKPPASAGMRPLAGSTMRTRHATHSTVALGTSSRQNSEM